MPIEDLFQEKLDDLRRFLRTPELVLCAVRHRPEMRRALAKVLSGLEDEPGSAHVFVMSESDFVRERQYAGEVGQALGEPLLAAEVGMLDEPAGEDLEKPAVQAELYSTIDPAATPSARCARLISRIADGLPDAMKWHAIILAPENVADADAFGQTALRLATATTSRWVKYIVFDSLDGQAIPDVAALKGRAVIQHFDVPPERIEKQVAIDLASGKLPPLQLRQYTMMAGAFAFSNHKYDEALKHQLRALDLAKEGGTPADQAAVLYNLGNTYLAQKRGAEAEQCFFDAARIAVDCKNPALAAMALTNLGVVLQRQDRPEEALAVFSTARRTFEATNHLPGQAHVLDCQASVCALTGRNDAAEKAWFEAAALYERIQAPALQDVRSGGRDEILQKLLRFYQHTKQKAKAERLTAQIEEIARA